jgi:very-short-patch-repair endonuclease
MECACGKTAIYRVGELGFCSAHRVQAVERIEKFGNPKAKKKRIGYVRMKPDDIKPIIKRQSTAERKVALQAEMRKNPTPAEKKLRELLKSCPELAKRFEFQAMLNGYIPDFLFRSAKLIIEADGWHHFTTSGKRADSRRTGHLVSEGYYVLRFNNREIIDCPESTLAKIIEVHRARLTHDVRPRK